MTHNLKGTNWEVQVITHRIGTQFITHKLTHINGYTQAIPHKMEGTKFTYKTTHILCKKIQVLFGRCSLLFLMDSKRAFTTEDMRQLQEMIEHYWSENEKLQQEVSRLQELLKHSEQNLHKVLWEWGKLVLKESLSQQAKKEEHSE